MPRSLDNFIIAKSSDGFLLQLEDNEGKSMEWTIDLEQLDLMAEEIDRHLSVDQGTYDEEGEEIVDLEDEDEEL